MGTRRPSQPCETHTRPYCVLPECRAEESTSSRFCPSCKGDLNTPWQAGGGHDQHCPEEAPAPGMAARHLSRMYGGDPVQIQAHIDAQEAEPPTDTV